MPNEQTLHFVVHGKPQPAGSKRGFVNKKTGAVIVTDANKNAKPWQAEVKAAGLAAINRKSPRPDLLRGPVRLRLVFYQQRPKGHYGTGRNAGNVKDSAPQYPATRPDVLKLARAVEDALTGIVWADDAQIVSEELHKLYGDPGCMVEVDAL